MRLSIPDYIVHPDKCWAAHQPCVWSGLPTFPIWGGGSPCIRICLFTRPQQARMYGETETYVENVQCTMNGSFGIIGTFSKKIFFFYFSALL